MDVLAKLYKEHFHSPPERVEPLPSHLGASGRQIVRLGDASRSAIGILYNVREENVAFIEFSRHFRLHHLPVPEIYAEALDQGAYLEEDLGDTTLYEFLTAHREGDSIAPPAMDAYRKAVAVLPRFQVEAGRDLNYKVCYPRNSFDRQSISWDLNYFKYYFLRLAGIPFNEQALENDYSRFTKFLLSADRDYFLYRDFQSRNIMLRDSEPWFVDYQGGRKGALQYDIASILFDAKADLPPSAREHLLSHYLDALASHLEYDRETFMRYYYAYVYVRQMQALGAYGFRGFYERKPLFLQSVPYALKNIRWLLHNAELPIALPSLMEAFRNMLDAPKLQTIAPAMESHSLPSSMPDSLTVRIFSFSFHRGAVPTDPSGNGGGFVFDARSVPNPGREERFKSLTGRDQLVVEYLDQQPAAHEFFAHVESLINASVKEYQRRRFKNLMVSFGCTGGQHRSVYFAELLARKLRDHAGVDVILQHRELEKLGK